MRKYKTHSKTARRIKVPPLYFAEMKLTSLWQAAKEQPLRIMIYKRYSLK